MVFVVCNGIVELHGGTMSVSSNGIGTGCTFHIDLPLARKETSNALNPSVMDEKEQDTINELSSPDPISPTVGNDNANKWLNRFSFLNFLQHSFSVTNPKVQPNEKQSILQSSCMDQVDKESSRMSRVTITLDGLTQSTNMNNHFPRLRNASANNTSVNCDDNCRRIVSYNDIHRTVDMLSRSEIHCTAGIASLNEIRRIASDETEIEEIRLRESSKKLSTIFPRPCLRRVLIVDDVPMNRKMLRRVLENRYDIIDEAENGQEAVDMVKATVGGEIGSYYDMITMDYQMPVLDGITATRRIRDLGYVGLIIAVTGNALREDTERFLSSGANKVLTKPLSLAALDSYLNSLNL